MERVWDYPRPPAVAPCDRQVRIEWAGEVLADSTHALRVLETSHPPTIYIPPTDVRLSLLTGSDAVNAGFDLAALPAAQQQEVGSSITTQVDSGGDTVAGVSYTQIVSRNDEVVTPYTNQFLTAGPGATVHNILLQNVCPLDQGEHLSVVYDRIALREMLHALDPAHAQAPACVPIAPVVGG
jgi:hypothetical protein